jgi:crotonobetainyl-CoA:carnitine CoA-transferase CaiB-like acyl-CoA transferase
MKPLAGLVVLDFSRVLAGPMATQILAEFGAEVIKVELPGAGDESRHFEPRLPGGESGYFFAFNRGKKSITLNLKSERGRRIARDLASQADVLIENFLPGTMKKLGLDYATLEALNPRLIYVSNTGFGQTGPYRDRKGYDTSFQALSGIMALTGYPDGPPAKVGVPISDLSSGLWIAISALTGLMGRHNTGRGCYVDLGMMDVQASLLTIAAARYFATGEDPQRTGTEHLGRVPSAAFQCKCGDWIHISGSDQHWPAICEVLGLATLAADPAMNKNAVRVTRRTEVMAAMTAAIGRRERAELAEALRARDVPTGEVFSVKQTLSDPHMTARGVVGTFDHPTEGQFRGLRTPVRFQGWDDPDLGAPPTLGDATESILQTRLGMTAELIAELKSEGTI